MCLIKNTFDVHQIYTNLIERFNWLKPSDAYTVYTDMLVLFIWCPKYSETCL